MNDSGLAAPILARLHGVRASGPHRWIARCPAHEDRSPSLSITGGEGGRLLLHCHAGCETKAILSAIGLTFSALFAAPLEQQRRYFPPLRCDLSPAEALRLIKHEVDIMAIISAELAANALLSDVARDRIDLAVQRITRTYARAWSR